MTISPVPNIAGRLLGWYDAHRRELPWRLTPRDLASGGRADPYRVWLSEIMLQQTTVEAVKPYFRAFLEKWPDVKALAAAKTEDVMKAWAGLGYYSRARNLKTCADIVARLPGGFPIARRQAGDTRQRRKAGSGRAARRFRAGNDGPWRNDLHTPASALHALSCPGGLPRYPFGRPGIVARPRGKTRKAAAARRRLRRHPGRRRNPFANASGQGAARRHERSPDDRLDGAH
jgi:hypothetical protein